MSITIFLPIFVFARKLRLYRKQEVPVAFTELSPITSIGELRLFPQQPAPISSTQRSPFTSGGKSGTFPQQPTPTLTIQFTPFVFFFVFFVIRGCGQVGLDSVMAKFPASVRTILSIPIFALKIGISGKQDFPIFVAQSGPIALARKLRLCAKQYYPVPAIQCTPVTGETKTRMFA